jgi:hypothetical protein
LGLDAAKREFIKKFQDKTGNSFGGPFEKRAGKYDLIQVSVEASNFIQLFRSITVNLNPSLR